MQTVILAGGRGVRLGALTERRPKPLVEVAGRPLMEHLLCNASAVGLRDFVVSTGYLGSMIEGYFGNGAWLGIGIEYVSGDMRGPEDALFAARATLRGPTFCCLCADSVMLPEAIQYLVDQQEQHGAHATFLLEDDGVAASGSRVRVVNRQIVGASAATADPVLVYNAAMRTSFLDALANAGQGRRRSFAELLPELDGSIQCRGVRAPFVNVNHPADLARAGVLLAGG